MQNEIILIGITVCISVIGFFSRHKIKKIGKFFDKVNRAFDNVDVLVHDVRNLKVIVMQLVKDDYVIIDAMKSGKVNGNVEQAKKDLDSLIQSQVFE
jgi:hypothetical protein